MLSHFANGLCMEEKSAQPLAPVVPLGTAAQFVNIVVVECIRGNGAIQVQLAEMRQAPVQRIGDQPFSAIFEVGRFILSPRALRQLFDKTQEAVRQYEEATGAPLPTESQYLAGAAMKDLLKPPDKPTPPKSEP
ncbi:MAG TPA: hypothetical protein VHR97_07860 [Candidatus Baltobacteraceae bacterium]|jgi:hypothetical protein|nr:hypothetical protein [Candidatus Baltobacteraceae bacterium]